MDTDLMMVIGVSLGVLAIPALLSAYSEGRPPRLAAIVVLIAGTLIVVALNQKPSGYTVREIFQAFGTVFAGFAR